MQEIAGVFINDQNDIAEFPILARYLLAAVADVFLEGTEIEKSVGR